MDGPSQSHPLRHFIADKVAQRKSSPRANPNNAALRDRALDCLATINLIGRSDM